VEFGRYQPPQRSAVDTGIPRESPASLRKTNKFLSIEIQNKMKGFKSKWLKKK